MPGEKEMPYHGALGYSPTGLPSDRIVYILPAARHVTLGFFFGTHLEDPEGLLDGTGVRMRHVKERSAGEIANPALERRIVAAHRDAGFHLAWLHASRKRASGTGIEHATT
jgi:hypothetical protein